MAKATPKRAPAPVPLDVPPPEDGDLPVRIEYVPLGSLKLHPRNPKDHDLGALAASFGRFGFVAPIIVDERSGYIAAGHGRYRALLAMKQQRQPPPARVRETGDGEWLVPVVRGVEFRDADAAAGYLVADNRLVILGGWKQDELASLLKELGEKDALAGTGYDGDDVDALLKRLAHEKAEGASPWKATEDAAPEDGSIYRLDEDPIFPSDNEYGIPTLRTDRLGTSTPTESYRKALHGPVATGRVLVWGTGAPEDWRKTVVAFYVDDTRFEQVWADAPAIGQRLLKQGVEEFIMPDFSTWTDDPRVVQMWNVYRNRWVARYWQELGLRVIPNLQYSDLDSLRYTLAGIPTEIPVAAVQIRSSWQREDASVRRAVMAEVLKRVRVDTLLVYATPSRFAEFADVFHGSVQTPLRVSPFSESIARTGVRSI
jgi:hypothetical protein